MKSQKGAVWLKYRTEGILTLIRDLMSGLETRDRI